MAQVLAGHAVLDAEGLSTRAINQAIKRLLEDGISDIEVRNPVAQHCLAVALKTQARIEFKGSVGWYAAGMTQSHGCATLAAYQGRVFFSSRLRPGPCPGSAARRV